MMKTKMMDRQSSGKLAALIAVMSRKKCKKVKNGTKRWLTII
jgi:hypothetical protein